MRHENIVRAFTGEAWALTPEKMERILHVVELRASGIKVSAEAIAEAKAERRTPTHGSQGTVAVLPLYGTVAHRMDMMMEMSGGTSTERFGRQLDAALSDPAVSAIVLDIDSPGGAVSGTEELAAKILAARGTKPIYATANSLAASAAYWIGSAADELAVTPSGEVGSIGVFMVHFDESRMMDAIGVTPTLIKAGAHKAEGNPYEPLDEEAREHLQALVDDVYGRFVLAVARARGVSVSTVKSDFGEGRCVMAREAVELGMADRVATLDEVISRAAQGKSLKSGRKAHTPALPMAAAMSGPGYTLVTRFVDAFGNTITVPANTNSRSAIDPIAAFAGELLEGDGSGEALPPIDESEGADTGAAPDEKENPGDQQAPQAKEQTVSANDTTVARDNGAAPIAVEERAAALSALAREHGKDMATYDTWLNSGKSVDAIRGELLAEYRSASQPVAQTLNQSAGALRARVGTERETLKPFATFGEQLTAVMHAMTPGGSTDPRLFPLAAVTGMSQGIPSEGGYTLSPQFSSMIWDRMNEAPDNLLGRTDQYQVEGDSLTFNANAETSRATGSRYGGIRSYWIAEADQMTASKVKFRQLKLEPHEMAVLVPLTDKLLRNSPVALEQYVGRAAADEINFVTGDALINGNGAGKPLGILSSGCKVEVAKETGQAADTVNQFNVSKMWARLHPRSRGNAIWLHNVDVEPALDSLSTVVQNVAGTENVGGYANKVFDAERRTLKGRPLVASEYCATVGDAGDLILVDMSAYATGLRGGIRSAASIHVRFEYNETQFRFLFEVDGQTWLHSAITPFKGSNSLTTVVTLQAR